ncbi:hypothetical protein ACMXYV_01780 [Neptuniibacter sp. SY11_33]|uniref:hypothetical protein n=1 Tax=Neptuniibacter sp. SY11_33 TaxID=3398215 RepID=UPI0039F5D8BE
MNRFSFWLVWAVGLVPMLVASLMFFTGMMIPEQRVHSGILLFDQHINDLSLVGNNLKQRKWQLLLTKQADCVERCEQWSKVLTNLHTALGKEQDRVKLLQVDLSATTLDRNEFGKLGTAIWVVDPLGNMVLRYTLSDEPSLILKDLRKLLKMSRIG